jgi:anti-sigma B factor antagonist
MLLQIEEKVIQPGVTLVELKGRLALGRESQRVESIADELVRNGHLKVVMDLSGVDYVDSAGIGILALISGRMKEAGGHVAMVVPEGRVLQMLNLTQMNRILSLSATVAEALGTFGETLPPAAA